MEAQQAKSHDREYKMIITASTSHTNSFWVKNIYFFSCSKHLELKHPPTLIQQKKSPPELCTIHQLFLSPNPRTCPLTHKHLGTPLLLMPLEVLAAEAHTPLVDAQIRAHTRRTVRARSHGLNDRPGTRGALLEAVAADAVELAGSGAGARLRACGASSDWSWSRSRSRSSS